MRWIASAVLVGCTSVLGCGESKPPAASITVEAEPTESPSPEQFLAGSWDGKLLLDEQKLKELDPVAIQVAREAEMQFEYLLDGTLRMSAAVDIPGQGRFANEFEGRWKLLAAEADRVTVQSIDQAGKTEQIELRLIDQNTMETSAPDQLGGVGILRLTRMR